MEFKIYGELFTYSDSRRVATKDAPSVSTDKEYPAINNFAYYVLINTWLMLVRDYTGYAHTYLGQAILIKGLIPVIGEAQACADSVVHGAGCTSSLWENVRIDIENYVDNNRRSDVLNIGRDPMATLLVLMRYPKRFSPSANDVIRTATLKDFMATERRTKALQRQEYSRFVVERVREEVHNLYPWDRICDDIEDRDSSDLRFSSGAGFDSNNTLGSKLRVISKDPDACFYFPQPFGVRMLSIPRNIERSEERLVRVAAVPKSYKAARIIAMEDTYRLAAAKDIEYIFRKYDSVAKDICLEDQSINQKLALEGSKTGFYATLDASHASDMISKTLFAELFPKRYVELVTPLMGTHCLIDGKKYPMQMASTSGHSLTFRHETIVYKCIALAADRLVCALTGDTDPFAWAYGDDTILPCRSAATAIDFYAALGMKINAEKSFFDQDNLYRESCGEEYYMGESVTSTYFPRFPVLGSVAKDGKLVLSKDQYNDEYRGKLSNSLTMLIDLQKKVFPISRSCATFLAQVVKAAYPKMTTSPSGTVCSDLWGYQDLGRAKSYSAYTVEEDSTLKYVSQRKASRHFVRLENLPLSPVAREAFDRAVARETLHCVPSVTYALDPAQDTELNRTIYQLYVYQDFLRHGPRYASPLDELLGISEPSPTFASVFGSRRLVINMK